MGTLTIWDRAAWLLLGTGAAAVLWVARALEPSAAGHGTHVQLGLPPCVFRAVMGVPCPGCGLTTSFAHLMRGELVAAVLANPLGVPLFLVVLGVVPLCVWGAWRGAPFATVLGRSGLGVLAVPLASGLFVAWFARLLGTAIG